MTAWVERMVWPLKVSTDPDGLGGGIYQEKVDEDGRRIIHFSGGWARRPPRRIEIVADPSNPRPLAGTIYDPARYPSPKF